MAKPCHKSKSCRFISMLVMTAGFFLVEIIVGYIVNSIALVADSFHMLSDVVALVVGFASIRISRMQSKKNTFGWQRAEVLGAMVNAVFLVALCFSITVESLQRLINIEEVENPQLMLIVGGAGLAVNIIGLFLFGSHGHSHGGGGSHGHSHGGGGNHGHSHGDHGHGHSHENHAEEPMLNGVESVKLTTVTDDHIDEEVGIIDEEDEMAYQLSCVTIMDSDKYEEAVATEKKEKKKKKMSSSSQLNMRGVFLHVLGDALGSVIVCISALIIWFVEGSWKYYVDPAMSIIMVIIIMSTTIPLLKESSFILLQSVPTHIDTGELKRKFLALNGVIGVHEFHIWQLAGNRIIGSVHIKIDSANLLDYVRIAGAMKEMFHEEGIHSVTVQPEFIQHYRDMDDRACALECGPDKDCYRNTCCGPVCSTSEPEKPVKENGKPVRLTAYSVPTAQISETPELTNGSVGVV